MLMLTNNQACGLDGLSAPHFVSVVDFAISIEVIKLLLDASAFHLSCCILLTVYSKTCSFYSSYFFALQ